MPDEAIVVLRRELAPRPSTEIPRRILSCPEASLPMPWSCLAADRRGHSNRAKNLSAAEAEVLGGFGYKDEAIAAARRGRRTLDPEP